MCCALVEQAGLSDRITVLFEDFRDLSGRYDKLVSIEMIEAVGWQNLGLFLASCSHLLEPTARCCCRRSRSMIAPTTVEKATRSFIKEYIFPGGSLPSLAAITRALARRTDLQTLDLDDITAHYVETLRRWREAFLSRAQTSSTRSVTTSASSGSGRSTSPTARAALPNGESATSRCCWASPTTARSSAADRTRPAHAEAVACMTATVLAGPGACCRSPPQRSSR